MDSTNNRLRWYLKKSARNSMALGAWSSGALKLLAMTSSVSCRVITYHRFATIPRDPFAVSPEDFTRQMSLLASRNLAVSLQDVQLYLQGQKQLRPGSVLVTIDDGFRSVYTQALPILKKYNIPAVVFITAGLIDQADDASSDMLRDLPEPYLSWDEIKQLADNGIVIGSHAWSHRSLGTMDEDEVTAEALRSRQTLEQHLQRPVTSFAYPFGTMADFNPMIANILSRNGYHCAFTSQHGTVQQGINHFLLPRIKVESGEGIWLFHLLIRGGLDGWRWIDRTFWRLQARAHG